MRFLFLLYKYVLLNNALFKKLCGMKDQSEKVENANRKAQYIY